MQPGYRHMLLSAVCFAAMATLVGVVHRLQPELTTAMTSTIRALVNLILLVAFAWKNPLRLLGDRRPALWLRGLFGALALLLYFGALARIGVGEAAFLNQTSAVWVALLAPLLLKERTGRWIWLAIAGAMIGMFLLSVPRLDAPHDVTGRLMGAVSGLLAALAYLTVRRAGTTNTPSVIVFYFTLVAAALSGGLMLLEPLVWPERTSIWLGLVGVGVFATFGQLLMTRAYREAPVASLSAVSYAGPLLASVFGMIVLQQSPDEAGWAGMALILVCGVALPFLTWKSPEAVSTREPPPPASALE